MLLLRTAALPLSATWRRLRWPFVRLIEFCIAEFSRSFSSIDDPAMRVDRIEQIIAEVRFSHNDKAPKGHQNQLFLSPVLVRLEMDFDGKKLMRKRMPVTQEVHYRGESYHKGKLKSRYFIGELCYFLPDERTIVFHPEKTMRRVLDARIDGTTYTVSADWQRAEQGLLAAAVNIRRALKIFKDSDPEVDPLFQNTASFVFGVDIKDALAVQAFAVCPDEKSAATLVEWAKALIAKEISEQTAVGAKKQGEKATSNPSPISVADLLRHVRMRQQGPKVRLHTHVTIDWAAFGKILGQRAQPVGYR